MLDFKAKANGKSPGVFHTEFFTFLLKMQKPKSEALTKAIAGSRHGVAGRGRDRALQGRQGEKLAFMQSGWVAC